MIFLVSLFSKKPNSKDYFVDTLRPHVDLMYRMAYRWTNNRDDAEGQVQASLAKLARRVDCLKETENPRLRLIKILYHQFVGQYRREQFGSEVSVNEISATCTRGSASILNDKTEANDSSSEDPASCLAKQKSLKQALDTLPAELKGALLLHDAEG